MSKTLRLVLFLLFVLAFLVSAPLLVLYTAGYRLDLTNGRIVHTAVLNISSIPRNASVFLDGNILSVEKTPSVIDTIHPGEHTIILEKQNYLPWETTLSFGSREARVLGPIVLFLENTPTSISSFPALTAQVHPTTNQFAFITQESSWVEVWVVDAQTTQKTLLMRLPFSTLGTYDLSWSPQGAYLLLSEKIGTSTHVSVARVDDGTVVNLPPSVENLKEAWWNPGTDNDVYLRTLDSLIRVDASSGEAQTLPFEADRVASFNGQHISLSQSDHRAVVSFQESQTVSIITYLPLGTYQFIKAPEGLVGLYETQRHRLILINANNREQPILINEEARLWKWHPDEDRLAYSSGYDLKTYVRSSHETHTLTRLSSSIDELTWYPKGSALIYRSAGQTVALNLDSTSILSQTLLAEGLGGLSWIDSLGTSLHILEERDGEWEWWTRPLQK